MRLAEKGFKCMSTLTTFRGHCDAFFYKSTVPSGEPGNLSGMVTPRRSILGLTPAGF